jgi:hypothetical protein
MAFFKQSRDQMKMEKLMSQLECAKQFFNPKDKFRSEFHLGQAMKALAEVRKAEAEYLLTAKGWRYIAELCLQLKTVSDVSDFEQMARDCAYIGDYAITMTNRPLGDK